MEYRINHSERLKFRFFGLNGHTKNVWMYGPHVNIHVKITVNKNCATYDHKHTTLHPWET